MGMCNASSGVDAPSGPSAEVTSMDCPTECPCLGCTCETPRSTLTSVGSENPEGPAILSALILYTSTSLEWRPVSGHGRPVFLPRQREATRSNERQHAEDTGDPTTGSRGFQMITSPLNKTSISYVALKSGRGGTERAGSESESLCFDETECLTWPLRWPQKSPSTPRESEQQLWWPPSSQPRPPRERRGSSGQCRFQQRHPLRQCPQGRARTS
jgi:hypothetical protein